MATNTMQQRERGALPAKPLPRSYGLDQMQSPAMLAAGIGLTGWGVAKRGLVGLISSGFGVALLYRWMETNDMLGEGRMGQLLNTGASRTTSVRSAITIDRPADELYARWRRFQDLPLFMRDIRSVKELPDGTFEWTAEIPNTGEEISWLVRLEEDVPGERIVWRSIEGSEVHNQGAVEFRSGSHSGETQVFATIEYRPPGGTVGKKVAEFLRAIPRQLVKENLRNFKHVVETGEVPTIEGQPSGRELRAH